jgi:hypothetical protein
VGGIGVGEAKTAGKFGVPALEQAARINAKNTIKILFKMDIPPIIPEEAKWFLRRQV